MAKIRKGSNLTGRAPGMREAAKTVYLELGPGRSLAKAIREMEGLRIGKVSQVTMGRW